MKVQGLSIQNKTIRIWFVPNRLQYSQSSVSNARTVFLDSIKSHSACRNTSFNLEWIYSVPVGFSIFYTACANLSLLLLLFFFYRWWLSVGADTWLFLLLPSVCVSVCVRQHNTNEILHFEFLWIEQKMKKKKTNQIVSVRLVASKNNC